jgi:hypothetical protein
LTVASGDAYIGPCYGLQGAPPVSQCHLPRGKGVWEKEQREHIIID